MSWDYQSGDGGMNTFLNEDFITLWETHKEKGIRYITSRMPPENRPKIETWIRKEHHTDMSPNILLETVPAVVDGYYLCRYMRAKA